VSNPSIVVVASAPSGSCTQNLPDQQVVSLGTIYTCQSGTWALVNGGSGGSGTVSSGTTGQLAYYPSNGTVVQGASGVTTDGAGGLTASTVTAGTTTPTTIGPNGVLLNGVPALQAQTSLNNYYSGGAGNLTGTGSQNTANGYVTLSANTTGSQNTANGYVALYSNTTGSGNSAQGYSAGQFISDGSTANATSSNSVYLGANTEAKASGDTNENVIGNGAVGNGSNTSTVGNTATVGTWLNGTQHITATAPITSAVTIAAYSTNAGGEITGLSAATSVTITFANSGWTNAAFCTANASTTLATNVYNSAQSKTAVTFTFPSLTGGLFYHCDGN
jgi:hypothetical protein